MDEKTKNIFDIAKSTASVIGQKISRVAEVAGDKAIGIIDSTKISVEIHDLENEIEKIYSMVGKSLYEQKSEGGDISTETFDEYFSIIEAKADEIKELKAKLSDQKSQIICPNEECGNICGAEDKFCSKCGAVIE